jgi:hypothetical protein
MTYCIWYDMLYNTYLSHVRDIKERGFASLSTPQVLLHDTSILRALVQHGQFVAGKGNHVPTQFLVQIIQGRLHQRFRRRTKRTKAYSTAASKHARAAAAKSRRHAGSKTQYNIKALKNSIVLYCIRNNKMT